VAELRKPSFVLPKVSLEHKGIVPDEHDQLQEADVAPRNNISMVGWTSTLRTPEYPTLDVASLLENGSFGPAENDFFHRATLFARARGLPRIYLYPRILVRGSAEKLMSLFS
jgi:acetyl-CoA carboxylase/biotin carboxylase 1